MDLRQFTAEALLEILYKVYKHSNIRNQSKKGVNMKLSEIFKITRNDTDSIQDVPKTDSASAERINRQIKSLTPGKQLQGEIIERNGNEVKIKLAGDLILSARMDRDVNVEEGQVLTFEVKNNGTTLSLSPLFTNTTNTDNVFKALQMANLPINETTISMTEIMMQQGMSVDEKSLQGVFRDIMLNPGTAVVNIVQLHQMGLPVNVGNLQQMENYKALTHQLVKGMTDVLKELPIAFSELYVKEGAPIALQMYSQLIKNLLPDTYSSGEGGADTALQSDVTGSDTQNLPNGTIDTNSTLQSQGETKSEQNVLNNPQPNMELPVFELLSQKECASLADLISAIPEESYPEAKELVQQILQGNVDATEVLKTLSELYSETDIRLHVALADIFRSGEYNKLLEAAVLKQWSIEPSEVMENKNVEELYTRLVNQLKGMKEVLDGSGAGQSSASKNVANLSQNIDFMNQMNQMYTYVQLPLKMNSKHANGELYVYTNKRSLAENDGNVSAFLHLDMEHLGPVDVYVAMQNNKVSTKFTLRDDAMLDFLNSHIHILNERLSKKGFTMQCEMKVREKQEKEYNPIDRILQADRNTTLLSQHAFDVRA